MDDKLNQTLLVAQQELAAIKYQYASAATAAAQPLQTAVSNQSHIPSAPTTSHTADHPAQKQLEIAEGVMLKLYKKNLALEHQIRQLKLELDTRSKTKPVLVESAPIQALPGPALTAAVAAVAPVAPVAPVPVPSPTKKESTPQTTAALQEELNTQRASCARFAAQNRALRSDFTRLAQQQIQPLLQSSSVGHATQEVLALLATTLHRFETERTAEVNNYMSRLKVSEEAHIELLAKCKMLERKSTQKTE